MLDTTDRQSLLRKRYLIRDNFSWLVRTRMFTLRSQIRTPWSAWSPQGIGLGPAEHSASTSTSPLSTIERSLPKEKSIEERHSRAVNQPILTAIASACDRRHYLRKGGGRSDKPLRIRP